MIVDTSAVLAILFGEEDAADYARRIAEAPASRMSAANWLEASIVIESRGGTAAGRDFDAFIRRGRITIEPVTREHVEIARTAYRQYGKGLHPAALNFGDCFAYALSIHSGEPLLFKGMDFTETDIERA